MINLGTTYSKLKTCYEQRVRTSLKLSDNYTFMEAFDSAFQWIFKARHATFKSTHQAQRFLGGHTAVHNLLNLGRYLVSAEHYRYFRLRAFATWGNAAVA